MNFRKKFVKNRIALFGAFVILTIVTAAVLAPSLSPHDPHEQYFDGLAGLFSRRSQSRLRESPDET